MIPDWSQREISHLIDMVPSHVWCLTADGQPTYCNRRLADYLGFDPAATDESQRTRLEAIIEAIHPDDAAAFRDALQRSLVTGEVLATRHRLRRADGVYRWMDGRADAHRKESRAIVHCYGASTGIGNQVHAQEALRGLADTAMALRSCQSLDAVVQTITDGAREIIGPHVASIGTADDQGWSQSIQLSDERGGDFTAED